MGESVAFWAREAIFRRCGANDESHRRSIVDSFAFAPRLDLPVTPDSVNPDSSRKALGCLALGVVLLLDLGLSEATPYYLDGRN